MRHLLAEALQKEGYFFADTFITAASPGFPQIAFRVRPRSA